LTVLLTVLSVLGVILKWILWIVLGVLALVLLILLIILFAPIRYSANGYRSDPAEDFGDAVDLEDEEFKETLIAGARMGGRAKITYLFHLIRAEAIFEDKQLQWSVKAAWKKIAGSEEPEETAPELTEASKPAEAKPTETAKPTEVKPTETAKPTEAKPAEPAKPVEAKPVEAAKPKTETTVQVETTTTVQAAKPTEAVKPAETKPAKKEKPNKPALPKKKESKPQSEPTSGEDINLEGEEEKKDPLSDLINNILDTIDKIVDKTWDIEDALDEKVGQLEDLWDKFADYPDKDKTIRLFVNAIKRLLKPLLPKTFHLNVDYGTGDPFTTAQILGYAEAFLPVLLKRTRKKDVVLRSDMEQQKVLFDLDTSGWFMLAGFIPPIVRVLCSRYTWRLVKFIKKMKA